VPSSSALRDGAEVDRPANRVAVGQGSAYDLYLSRELRAARLERVAGAAAVLQAVQAGRAQVAARIRQVLEGWAGQDPFAAHAARPLHGDRAGDGAARRARRSGGAGAAGFVERMKSGGFVAAALARHDVEGASVAPAA
jgi:polar amino acid transport system substrate-binding protein